MQSGHPPLLHSRSGQSDGETALNFDLKFELDCTRVFMEQLSLSTSTNNTAGFNLHDNDETE